MHVDAKKIAISGVLAAFSAVMLILSSVIESSSLFFIAAASFCVGISLREWGVRFGTCYFVASALVNFLVAPNKMYCFTFSAMGLYILLSEILWEKIAEKETLKNRTRWLWIGKYVIFNMLYMPVLFVFPELLFAKNIPDMGYLILLLAGQ